MNIFAREIFQFHIEFRMWNDMWIFPNVTYET
jgi:hypothetical protein